MILQKLYKNALLSPRFDSWEEALDAGVFRVSCYEVGDVLAEAEDVASSHEELIPCGACRGEVRAEGWVGWVKLDYGPDIDAHGWERLCPSCYQQMLAETAHIPDGEWPEGLWPKVLLAARVEPKSDLGYRNPPYHLMRAK